MGLQLLLSPRPITMSYSTKPLDQEGGGGVSDRILDLDYFYDESPKYILWKHSKVQSTNY